MLKGSLSQTRCASYFVKMLTVALLLLLGLNAYVSAVVPGFSTAGLRFVVAFPIGTRLTLRRAADVVITSDESSAWTDLLIYSSKNSVWRQDGIYIPRRTYAVHSLYLENALSELGIHKVTIVRSTAPIRVFVRIFVTKLIFSVYGAMPEQSCYRSYYVTTSLGYPSIMVMSFAADTFVRVKFPQYDNHFDEFCHADTNCAPGKTVRFKLNHYSVWYFHIDKWNVQFHNTLIQSDKPIFVLSGSKNCLFLKKAGNGSWKSKDHCLTSMKPTWTWGKTYVVPILRLTDQGNKQPIHEYLRMNAKKFPLEIMIHEGLSYDKIARKDNIRDHQEMYSFDIDSPHVIHAEVPFGLYLFSPPNPHWFSGSIFSLIPVEQWMHGNISKNLYFTYIRGENYYFSTDNANRRYSFTINYSNKLTDHTQKRIMNYIMGEWGNFLLPYDYYQGAIYYPRCRESAALVDDGIDNDCDGHIDEEIVNIKDDDKDGRIDEDIAETVRNGGWGSWTEMCTCLNNRKSRRSVRECNSPTPSRLGLYCPGSSFKCEPPGTCSASKCKTVCKCPDGCLNCNKYQNETCTVCKEGYVTGGYCLTPCPHHWTGRSCIEGPLDILHQRMKWSTEIDYLHGNVYDRNDNSTSDGSGENNNDSNGFGDYDMDEDNVGQGGSGGTGDKVDKTNIAIALLCVFAALMFIAAALLVYIFVVIRRKMKEQVLEPMPQTKK